MYDNPARYWRRPEKIDADIRTFIEGHGFTGFHTVVCCRWFDIGQERSTGIKSADPDPDPRTFEALEMLIVKVHATGGVVHIWAWGDESRRQTPARWGINGPADRRLQRYIAARLGPLPGWTMGYGYDLWEWVKGEQLASWHEYMQRHLGWPHMLGARSYKNRLEQICEAMDYASYEQHRPDYRMYLRTIGCYREKPAFSEDRFRIRDRGGHPYKDYTEEMTRRGLWHSTMAGGVANIWGNLAGGGRSGGGSKPYPHPYWVKTWAPFFARRFSADLTPAEGLSDGLCLRSTDRHRFIFYREDAASIRMDLGRMPSPQPAVAVDALRPYAELDLGTLSPGVHTWRALYTSDWAIAVGRFAEVH